ncbi:MAG: TIGR02147 family protein, partial [Bdellovibrionales bacterium]|nr:TIGR02147 family protein [Bdellovibrionales bacterium]
ATELQKRQGMNKYYSLRAFSRDLGLSPSVLSRLMSGKRSFTLSILNRLTIPLSIAPEEFEGFRNEILVTKNQDFEFRYLELEEFKIIQDWYNYAILEMIKLHDFQPSEVWIAKRLSISEDDALIALERLVKLELLIQNTDGTFSKSKNTLGIIQTGFSTVAMRNRQKQILTRAIESLDLVEFDKRDQASITLSLDSDILPEVKLKIREMRRSLADFITKKSKKRDQVYELSTSFFPWTN